MKSTPATGGTPHEGACDNGLLALAATLRELGRPEWERYLAAARLNLQAYYLNRLWDDTACFFRDNPTAASFVPNKAATACDALFRLAALTGEAVWAERYALPTLDRVLEHQVKGGDPLLEGAIAQNSFGSRQIQKYFPIYNARCVSALLRAYNWTSHEKYLTAALAILSFITRWIREDGSLPTVVYFNGKPTFIRPGWPLWGMFCGAADELRPYGFDADLQLTQAYMLGGQDRSGGIGTARGFAAQAGHKLTAFSDVRDLLHVAGWCDKAFRYLSSRVSGEALPTVSSEYFEAECIFQKQPLLLIETATNWKYASPAEVKPFITGKRGRPALAWPSRLSGYVERATMLKITKQLNKLTRLHLRSTAHKGLAGGLLIAVAAYNWRLWQRDKRVLKKAQVQAKATCQLTDQPPVSVMVAAWNEGWRIEDHLRSFQALHYPHIELIICAGGSDDTFERTRRYQDSDERITVLEQQPGEGKQAALARCYQHAKADFIYLTDADCLFNDCSLQQLLTPLVNEGEQVATGFHVP